jgi:hypothetical protein
MRLLRSQRGCGARQWGSLLVLGQLPPRSLQRWRDGLRLSLPLSFKLARVRPRNPRCPGFRVDSPDPGQIGIPQWDSPISRIPGSESRPNRDSDSHFPNPGIPTKPGFKSGEIPIFFAAARTVIKRTCQRHVTPHVPRARASCHGRFASDTVGLMDGSLLITA